MENDLKTFFQKVGKVLYAIAIVDNNIAEEEYKIIKQIVDRNWDLYNLDSNKTKNLPQLKNVFDHLCKYPQSVDEILEEFKAFKSNNPNLFSDEIKTFIYKTANEVASSYANKNKSELIILGRLHFILKD
ncbi:hypothetical protein [Pseudofulvibacter geojedonensis]|uniref:Co-chaperone DjlA N-terminal domain-containing protein n=1 Tax=Pseudofulvibacter geojedonensis TaxID=1123758 RepID=A0ABW3I1Q3_9FLAO